MLFVIKFKLIEFVINTSIMLLTSLLDNLNSQFKFFLHCKILYSLKEYVNKSIPVGFKLLLRPEHYIN